MFLGHVKIRRVSFPHGLYPSTGSRAGLHGNLFRHPYTKIEFIERDLSVSRPTATKYLGALEKAGLVRKMKLGRPNFNVNQPLFTLLSH